MCSRLFKQYFEICNETKTKKKEVDNYVWGAILTHHDLGKLKRDPKFEEAKRCHSNCVETKKKHLEKMQKQCPTMYDWTSSLSRRGWIGHSDDFPVRIV